MFTVKFFHLFGMVEILQKVLGQNSLKLWNVWSLPLLHQVAAGD